ncbi:hypothetical protein ACP70R_006310 [Stipagrostis hirtigluma subsp. patula]
MSGGAGGHTFAGPSAVSVGFSRGSGSGSAPAAATDSAGRSPSSGPAAPNQRKKPPFRPAADDTKPVLRDPISRSDPVETEQAVLRLPPFP